MLSQLVGFSPVERAIITRREGINVRATRTLVHLVDDFPVERANVTRTELLCVGVIWTLAELVGLVLVSAGVRGQVHQKAAGSE